MAVNHRIVRACCALAVMFGLGSEALRAQNDETRPEVVELTLGSGEDGLVLDVRSTPKIRNTTARVKGEGLPSGASASASARERAQAFINANAAAFGLRGSRPDSAPGSRAEVAVIQELPRDEVGVEHVRFRQLHDGIPVTGGELLIHLKGGRVVSAQTEVLVDSDFEKTPKISAEDALRRAQELMRRVDPAARQPAFSAPRLEVFNKGILQEANYPTRLTWYIEANTERFREAVWVDAITGGIVLNFNQMPTALNRRIYTADSTDTLPGRLVRTEGSPDTGDLDVDRAYQYSGDTYNYFWTTHGRDSYDGAGAALISTVRACIGGCPYANASWNGQQMIYGAGYSHARDVVGHELTHAVVNYSANLFYYMQSGALNESYADIFGETIDQTNNPNNATSPVKWVLGENLPDGAIRNMRNPWMYGNPGKVSDPEWHTDQTSDGGGVHVNSGVPNLAYALMVDGGSFNGRNVTSIGLHAAGKIQYRALTRYLTSGSNFLDNYRALLQACQDLIGTSGITATTCTQVKTAAEAVEMNGLIPFHAPIPVLCPTGQTVTTLFQDDFETTVTGNWFKRTLRGTGSWVVPDTGWAKSGTRMAWGEGFPTYADVALEMAKSFSLPSQARLQFNHGYAFEVDWTSAYDGGVIEYSEDGGLTWKDAGSLIVAGDRYDPNAPIDSWSGNSLAGRLAFVGSSFGYTGSQLDLASLAGKSVRFRFRVGTDELVGNTGWVVDDVRLYACSTPPSSFTISGRVTKAGVALAGVTVRLSGGKTATDTTDSTGAFSFGALPAGATYTVTPSLTNHGFTPTSRTYSNLQANQTTANFTAAIVYTISGRVTKAGVALAGVTVRLSGGKTATDTTDSTGAFSFGALAAGATYTVTPSLTNHGFTPTSRTYSNLQANQTAATFTAAVVHTISGRVTKAGGALAGVTVRLSGGKTATDTTDSTGAFSFGALPAGATYTVTPSLTNHGFTPTSRTYSNLQANQTAASFTAVVVYTISGRATKGGVALAGVTVRLSGGKTATDTTDSTGAFSFGALPAGATYTVTPSLTSHVFTPTSRTYSNLQANQTAATFTAAVVHTISGRVTKAGVALAGVTVRLSGGKTATDTTDSTGAFSFGALVAGATYTVTPSLTSHVFTPTSRTYSNLQANQTAASFTAAATATTSMQISKGRSSLSAMTLEVVKLSSGTVRDIILANSSSASALRISVPLPRTSVWAAILDARLTRTDLSIPGLEDHLARGVRSVGFA